MLANDARLSEHRARPRGHCRSRAARDHGTQWNASLVPALPVQAPDAHPDQAAHFAPAGHCESLVHQQGTPPAVHWPVGDETLLQLPIEHDQALATEVAVTQSSGSAVPLPVQVPVHWPSLLTHLPVEQFESSTQRQAVFPELITGAGVRVVMHIVPPIPMHGTELGGGMHPCPSSVPVPVQGPVFVQLLLCELGMQWPLGHATSLMQ
jgi:hypothetical protein